MKKFLLILATLFAFTVFQSCKEPIKVTYDATVQGDADGDVTFNFPDGIFQMNGTANLNFHYGNVPDSTQVYTLMEGQALNAKEQKAVQAFEEVRKEFNVTSASGTYDLYLYAWVEAYGIRTQIKEHFTNR